MGTVEALQARKQALLVAEMEDQEVQSELRAAALWLDLPKAARKRIYALSPETVAAFCRTNSSQGGTAGMDEWLALKLKKRKEEHVFYRREVCAVDTPEGAGVKILGSLGREWCMKLDNEPVTIRVAAVQGVPG